MPGRTFVDEHRRRSRARDEEWCNTCEKMQPRGHSLVCDESLPPIEPKATGVVYSCVKTESSSQLLRINPDWQDVMADKDAISKLCDLLRKAITLMDNKPVDAATWVSEKNQWLRDVTEALKPGDSDGNT